MAPRHPSFVTGTFCPQCSEDIPSDAPERLCPSCLFAAAVTAPRDATEDANADAAADTDPDNDHQTTAADAGDDNDDEPFDSPQFGFAETAHDPQRCLMLLKTAAAPYLPASPDATLSLDARFNRAWAINILELALRRVRLHWVAAGRVDEFDGLKYALVMESAADGPPSAGEPSLTSAGSSSSPVALFRRRFHQCLRQEIARTVVHPDDVDDEIWELFRALQPFTLRGDRS